MSFPALEQAIRDAGLEPVPEDAAQKFQLYLDLLLKWNSKLNLTAIRDPQSILRRHFIECIQCAQALPVSGNGATLLDFGSGAGLPGIPIAICRPELQVTLAESQRKKSAFLREVVRSLGLRAEVFDGRVEDIVPERVFDFVTLRAVDHMAEACRIGVARVRPDGWIVAFITEKSRDILEKALPGVAWGAELVPFGMDHGIIAMGKRTTQNVPCGTSSL